MAALSCASAQSPLGLHTLVLRQEPFLLKLLQKAFRRLVSGSLQQAGVVNDLPVQTQAATR